MKRSEKGGSSAPSLDAKIMAAKPRRLTSPAERSIHLPISPKKKIGF